MYKWGPIKLLTAHNLSQPVRDKIETSYEGKRLTYIWDDVCNSIIAFIQIPLRQIYE